MKRLLGNIVVGFLALYLATLLVPNVEVTGSFEEQIKALLFAGIFLGLVNFFIKPVINLINKDIILYAYKINTIIGS